MRTAQRTALFIAVVAVGVAGCAKNQQPAAKPVAASSAVKAPSAKPAEKYAGQAVAGNRLGSGDALGSDLYTPKQHREVTASLPQE